MKNKSSITFLYNIVILLLISSPLSSIAQSSSTVQDQLWLRVQNCFVNFEDADDDGMVDFDSTSTSDYLEVSGMWPTCGCECISVVRAFPDSHKKITFFQVEVSTCDWNYKLLSNKDMEDIFPSLSVFAQTSGPVVKRSYSSPIFFLSTKIPETGNITCTVDIIPLGLRADGDGLICTHFAQKSDGTNIWTLEGIQDIAHNFSDTLSIYHIISGDIQKINSTDLEYIQKRIDEHNDGLQSIAEYQVYLTELKQIYDTYVALSHNIFELEWNPTKAKFEIISKKKRSKYKSFIDFLVKGPYWSLYC